MMQTVCPRAIETFGLQYMLGSGVRSSVGLQAVCAVVTCCLQFDCSGPETQYQPPHLESSAKLVKEAEFGTQSYGKIKPPQTLDLEVWM